MITARKIPLSVLRIVDNEDWTGEKLNRFINYFNLKHKDVAAALGLTAGYIHHLIDGSRPLDKYKDLLTAFCSATIKAKIEYTKTQAAVMIDYYKSFNVKPF